MNEAARSERWLRAAVIAGATIAGAWLRLRSLGGPSLWLDEILNVDLARGFFSRSPLDWFAGFESENGPLYYLLQALWLGLPAPLDVTFRLSASILGIASIPLFWLALRPLGERIALVAATLLAVSPIHVYYSREGRPYAALVLFAIVLLGAIARARCGAGIPPAPGREASGEAGGTPAPRRAWMRAAMVVPFLAAVTAATAAPLLVTCGAVFLYLAVGSRIRRCFHVAAAHALALAYLAVLYLRFPRNEATAGFPTDAAGTLERIATSLLTELFTERAPASPWLLGAMLLLAFAGAAILAVRRGARSIVAMAAGIAAATVAALALGDHWVSPRYLLPILPPLLAMVAVAIDASAGGLASRFGGKRAASAAAALLTIVLAIPLGAIAREDALWKADWKSIASTLLAHARPGDEILAADSWMAYSLRHHLAERRSSLRVIDAGGSAEAAAFVVGRRARVWLMSGGYGERGDAAEWMRCRFLLVGSEPVENLRLFYAPGLADFLLNRATRRELARIARTFQEGAGGRLEMGRMDDAFLGDGWHGPDVVGGSEVRWARERATLLVPRWPDGAALRFSASPIRTPMDVEVAVDGWALGALALREGEGTYSLALPRASAGMHDIALSFSRTVRPSDISDSGDTRPLSVLFNWIEIAPRAGAPRTAGSGFRPDRAAPASEEPRIVPRELPEIPEPRLARLLLEAGYEPEREIPRLRARTADLVDLVADAIRADCGSDEEFVARLYLLVMDTLPDEEGTTRTVARMRRGAAREQIIDWTLESWARAPER